MFPQYQTQVTAVADGNSAQPRIDSQRRFIVTGESAAPVPIVNSGAAPVGGGITWGAPQAVTLTVSSQTLIAANAARKAIQIINRSGNAQVSYDLSGGTVTLIGGVQMSAPQRDWYSGAECPVGAITIIGTNGQLVTYVEGT